MWQLWDRKVRQVEVVGNGMLIIGKWHWLHPSGFSWMWSCTIAYQSWDIHCQKCLTSNDRNPYTRRIYNNHSLPGPHRQYFDQRKSSAVLSASRMTSDRNRWQNLNSPQTICLVSSLSQLKRNFMASVVPKASMWYSGVKRNLKCRRQKLRSCCLEVVQSR